MSAKDRARDSKRVYQSPKSHVTVRPQDDRNVFNKGTEDEYDDVSGRVKYNAMGKTDTWHNEDARRDEHVAKGKTSNARKAKTLPVQKFDDTK
jgi:hypothetical protein